MTEEEFTIFVNKSIKYINQEEPHIAISNKYNLLDQDQKKNYFSILAHHVKDKKNILFMMYKNVQISDEDMVLINEFLESNDNIDCFGVAKYTDFIIHDLFKFPDRKIRLDMTAIKFLDDHQKNKFLEKIKGKKIEKIHIENVDLENDHITDIVKLLKLNGTLITLKLENIKLDNNRLEELVILLKDFYTIKELVIIIKDAEDCHKEKMIDLFRECKFIGDMYFGNDMKFFTDRNSELFDLYAEKLSELFENEKFSERIWYECNFRIEFLMDVYKMEAPIKKILENKFPGNNYYDMMMSKENLERLGVYHRLSTNMQSDLNHSTNLCK